MKQVHRDVLRMEKVIGNFASQDRISREFALIRSRYRSKRRWEHHRSRIESELLKKFGTATAIAGRNNHRRVYRWHPVEAFQLLRPLAIFTHISDADIAQEISSAILYRNRNFDEHSLLSWEVAHCDAYGSAHWIAVRHGLWCQGCRAVKDCNQFDFFYATPASFDFTYRRPQRDLALCDACVLENKARAFMREEKRRIQERQFKEALARKRSVQEAERERTSAEYRERKALAKSARRAARIEREAAYQLVKELGLIDRLRQSPETLQ